MHRATELLAVPWLGPPRKGRASFVGTRLRTNRMAEAPMASVRTGTGDVRTGKSALCVATLANEGLDPSRRSEPSGGHGIDI